MKKDTIKDVEQKLKAAEEEYERVSNLQRQAINEYIKFENDLIDRYEKKGKVVYYLSNISVFDPRCTEPLYEKFIEPEKLTKEDQKQLQEMYDKRYLYKTNYTKVENLKKRLARMKDAEKGINPKTRTALNNINYYRNKVEMIKNEIAYLNEDLAKWQARVDNAEELINSIGK